MAHTPRGTLRRAFGPHAGAGLHHLAWGRDGQRVINSEPERSVGSQETFGRDTDDPAVVRRELLRMADRTASRLRKAGMVGRTITLSVRFADFTELTRSATLPTTTDVTEEIYTGRSRCTCGWDLDRARVRRVGVRVEGLIGSRSGRPATSADRSGSRLAEADQAVDAAVGRFGPAAVRAGHPHPAA